MLKVPSAGSWQVYGYAHGYRRQAFEQHENFLAGVVLSATAPTYDLRFSLEPDSAISGFVLDEAGEGVRNARGGVAGCGGSRRRWRRRPETRCGGRR